MSIFPLSRDISEKSLYTMEWEGAIPHRPQQRRGIMDPQVEALLKEQVNQELYSAYFYLAIAGLYQGRSLDGFSHWFEAQAREEQSHALKILKYLQDNRINVEFAPIAAPVVDFKDNREPLAATLRHEQHITELIHSIYREARDADDFRTCQFMEWFIAEQGEEEKNTGDLIARFDLFGEDARSLYLLNAELKTRA